MLKRSIAEPSSLLIKLKDEFNKKHKHTDTFYVEIIRGEWDSTIYKPLDKYVELHNWYIRMPYDGIDDLKPYESFQLMFTKLIWQYNL